MRRLPAWLHRRNPNDLVLGRTGPLPFSPLYTVPEHARSTHMYVIGITGKGKSKLLEYCIFQDIQAHRGCVLIDPHSDLCEDVLKLCLTKKAISTEDAERIVYFEPTRTDYFIPFNVLKTEGNSYSIAQRIVEAFRRTWPDSLQEAPHFSNVATAALITLVENDLTLIDMHRLLVDDDWRNTLLENVSNPEVVSFFHERYDKWGRDAPVMRESTLNKVAAFAFNPYLRLILGHPENKLDLRKVMDEGKVLLVDLGRCDGETRRLLGSLLVTGLEQAAVSRQNIPKHLRRPCYAYIDEFQDFAANPGSVKSLAQILSECRKFGLHLTLAHQNLSQVSERMLGAIGNIQTRVVFGISRQDAEWFAREVGEVDTQAIKHDALHNMQHPMYMPLVEQWAKWVALLKHLPSRRALISDHNGLTTMIWTILIKTYNTSDNEINLVYKSSLHHHGVKSVWIEQNQKPDHYAISTSIPLLYEAGIQQSEVES